MFLPLPPDPRGDGRQRAPTDARAGTRVALGFPGLALAALAIWLASGPAGPALSIWTLLVLPLICAAYGLFPFVVGTRTTFTFEAPTVLLAGLVGGPLAGVLAGVGAGLGDVNAVWPRRSAYAGLAMLYGFCAGLAGVSWRSGSIPLAGAVALAGVAYLAVSAAGLVLVLLDRGGWRSDRLVRAVLVDVAELAVWAPLLALFAQTFGSSPGFTSLAIASALGVVAFGAWALTTQRSLTERERLARLTDPLTGALARPAFESELEEAHERVVRGERPTGIVVVDVDHFRELNKRHGHLGGDRALRFVVAQIRSITRPADVVARWGGDELCLIAPELGTVAELERLCERIRSAVADSSPGLGAEGVPVTVSVGATLLVDWTAPEEAFGRADEALYRAKRVRDAVCVLPPAWTGDGAATLEPVRAAVRASNR